MFSNLLSLLPFSGHFLSTRAPINDPRWKPGVKWQIEIQSPLDPNQPLIPDDAVVWDIDLFQAAYSSPGIIKNKLKAANKIVLCYFSAGTVHDDAGDSNDPDLGNFTSVTKGDPYFKYPEEHWIDIRNPVVLKNMEWRVQLAQSVGCDGIDPDNIDGYKLNRTTNAPQNGLGLVQSDYQTYFRSLSDLAKKYNLKIGQKNAPELTRDSVSFADFAVLEECLTSEHEDEPLDVCDSWQPYVQSKPGKPVFQVEYPVSVQPCDVLQDDAANCPQPILCPQGPESQQNFTYYCTNDSTGGPPKTNDTGFSLIMKQDGSACGLGNWTEYCDVNSPIYVHVITGDEPEEQEPPMKRRWMA
jgi:hypothetical protein